MSAERFNSDLYLTTSQVAQLLDVHASTVKRWCNDGELAFDKTGGGHRRIHLNDVLGLAREREIPTFLEGFGPYEGHVWTALSEVVESGDFGRLHSLAMGWLMRGKTERVAQLFLELGRHPQIPFEVFCDQGVRGFMADVGSAWRAGQLRVGEEHMLTETLTEVLLRLKDEMPRHPAAHTNGVAPRPVAVVGAMEGDRHTLGVLCIRMELERMGWQVHYLGADVPVEDFSAMQRSREASLVCISFAPPRTGADMQRCVRILAEFYDAEHPFALVLGGHAASEADFSGMDTPFAALGTFVSVTDFHEALLNGFASALPAT
ncbi:MAG: helix-turn-helix domain-containing protein [Gemmatimonadota bacterium]